MICSWNAFQASVPSLKIRVLFNLAESVEWGENYTATKMGFHNLSENHPTSHKCEADGLAVVCH